MSRRRTWRRIKRGSNCSLIYFWWCQTSCTNSRKVNIYFSRSVKENAEIANVKITLVNLVLWYFGCPCSTHASLLMSRLFSKKLLEAQRKGIFSFPAAISHIPTRFLFHLLPWDRGFPLQTGLGCTSSRVTVGLGFTGTQSTCDVPFESEIYFLPA